MMQLPPGAFRPGSSMLHELDAAVKLICLVLLLLAETFAGGIAGHAVMLGLALAVVYLSQLELSEALYPLKRIWGLLVFFFLVELLLYPSEHIWFRWWIFGLSQEGLIHGIEAVIRASVAVLLFSTLSAVTSPMKLTYGLEKILRPVSRLGFPAASFARLIAAVFQLIPLLFDEADRIRRAQTARGGRFESRNYFDRVSAMLPLVLPLVLAALRRASALARLTQSREYGAASCRREIRWEKLSLQDASALLVCFAALALQVFII